MEYVLGLAKQFHAISIYNQTPFDVDTVRALINHVIEVGAIFINDLGGFIAATISPLMFSPSVLIATELTWYSPNGGGRQLREAFETWAGEVGASAIQLSAPANEHFDKLHDNMLKNGYALAELSYLKGV